MGSIRLRFGLGTGAAMLMAALAAWSAYQSVYGSFSTADLPFWRRPSAPSASQAFEPGQPLHCSGIQTMTPREAGRTLTAMGYRVRFVLDTGDDVVPVTAPPSDAVLRAVSAVPGSSYTSGHVTVPVGDGPGKVAHVIAAPSGSSGWSMAIPQQDCG